MKKKSFWLCLILLICSFKSFAADVEYIHPFKLNPINDGIQLGVGAALAGSGLLCDKFCDFKNTEFNLEDLDKSRISFFEQMLMRPYSKPLDITGTVFEASLLLAPAIFVSVPKNEWLTIGVMYGESLMLAYGLKQWGKILVNRPRPYMYFDDYPGAKVEDGDWNCSFPSGHTTLSFTAAAFTSYVFSQYYPDSKLRFAVVGISFGVAATTGVFRMLSGNHFFTDVLAGAIIGTASGLLIPYLHTTDFYKKFEKKNKKVEVAISPVGMNFQIHF